MASFCTHGPSIIAGGNTIPTKRRWLAVAATKAGQERSIYIPAATIVVDQGSRGRENAVRSPLALSRRHDVFPEMARRSICRQRQVRARIQAYDILVKNYPGHAGSRLTHDTIIGKSASKVAANPNPYHGSVLLTCAMVDHSPNSASKSLTLPEYCADWGSDAVWRKPNGLPKDDARGISPTFLDPQRDRAVVPPTVTRDAGGVIRGDQS